MVKLWWIANDRGLRGSCRRVRSDHRLLPERRRLPAPPRRVALDTRLTLPVVRDADQAVRQRPGIRLALAAGTLPRLSSADLAPLSPGRGRDGRALCAGRSWPTTTPAGRRSGFVLVLVLVPVALIDLDHRLIPNKITAPAAVLALVIGTALDPGGELERLIAGAAAGGFLLLAALAYPRGMGMGDVKLAGVLGLFLGRAVGPAMLIALVAGVIVGVVIMRRAGVGAGRKTAIPFGPFLALGGLVGSFAGNALVSAYLSSIGQS